MKMRVEVGGKISREAWERVTYKLLDLVGGGLDRRSREGVEQFIRRAGRAWDDLEQVARDENPGAGAPPIV